MAHHAGVLFFDRPATQDDERALAAGLERLSLNGADVTAVRDGNIAFAQARPAVWRNQGSSQVRGRSGWDGRLDNRDDLLLQLSGKLEADVGDHELAVRAFERWGVDGLRKLIGDWSFTFWNADEQMLCLARDYMGVRPFYYCASERSVMWSSNLGELVLRSGRVQALSESFVAAYLAQQFSCELTPYQGIAGVPPGWCLTFSTGTRQDHRRTQFWRLRPGRLRYRDRGQYEEHLRALWFDAVRSRLNTMGDVWAELSGGLDSSSVVCTADLSIKAGKTPASRLRLASHATLHSIEGDERRFIAEVERQVGVAAVILGVEDHADCVDERWGWVTPLAARGVGLARVRHIEAAGGRVVLSGRGGDAVMGCEPDNSVAVLDDLAEGCWLKAAKEIRLWSRASQKPFIELAFNLARTSLWRSSDIPSSKRRLAAAIQSFASDGRLNLPNQPPGMVFAYPFFHRPLVEFVLAIPGEELSAPGELRSLMRRAFAGFVPARILQRTSKGYYPPASARAARAAAVALGPAARFEVVQRGWIDPAALEAATRRAIDGAAKDSANLRRVLRLEEWLRLRSGFTSAANGNAGLTSGAGPSAIPQRKEVNSDAVLNA